MDIKKSITMADVAKHAKVSKSTVSQYLNGRFNYMSEETRKRVEESVRTLGYHPNIIARSLKQRKTSTIGLIVGNILHSFQTQVIRAIEDTCNAQGMNVIVCNADNNPEKEERYITTLRAKQVDGLIIFPTEKNTPIYKSLVDEGFPMVFVDRKVDRLDIDTILLDNRQAVFLGVEQFAKHGHERIGLITPSLIRNITPRVERHSAFREVLSYFKLNVHENFIKELQVEEIQSELENIFLSNEPPTAMLAGNDLVLMEILAFIKKNQMNIPADLSLISIDEVPFASLYHPGLTTIAPPAFEMGQKAADLLLEKIQQVEIETTQVYRFEPKLILRESVQKI